MNLKYEVISADDHVQEHPEVWTSRMSKAKWGERIPQIARTSDGSDHWMVDGKPIALPGIAMAAAAMADRAQTLNRWDEVPPAIYSAPERLKAMDTDGVDYSVLYPSVGGLAGEMFRQARRWRSGTGLRAGL